MFQPMNFIEFLTLPPEHPLWQREREMIEKHVDYTTPGFTYPELGKLGVSRLVEEPTITDDLAKAA